jgi:hypothetical protein
MRRRFVIACALLSASVLWPAAAGAAEQAVTFGADPAPGSSVENGYFSLHLVPGGTMRQTLRLSNTSDKPAELHLAGVDASTGNKGSVAYGASQSTPAREGGWIHLDETVVRLPASRGKDVAFDVRVPTDARPGVHLAGIVVFAPTTATSETATTQAGGGSGAGAVVVVESRRAVAVQITLPGRTDPELMVSGVTTEARPDGLDLIVSIANEGFGLTKATGKIVLSGAAPFTAEFPIDTFVPATDIKYPVPWTQTPKDGRYHASVVIDYGGKQATFNTDFVVGAGEQAALENRVEKKPATPTTSAPGKSSLPVALVAVVAVGAGVGGGALIFGLVPFLLRRRRRGDDGPPAA